MENNSDYYGEKQLDASESKGRNDDYARDYTITFELGVELGSLRPYDRKQI
jgi:hypothetical protein